MIPPIYRVTSIFRILDCFRVLKKNYREHILKLLRVLLSIVNGIVQRKEYCLNMVLVPDKVIVLISKKLSVN